MTLQQQLQQAMALHQAGKLAEAEPLYVRALRDHPNAYPVLHLAGLLRYQQGRLDEALALMERALKVQPGAPETLSNYGLALSSAGRFEQALAALDQTLKARPAHGRSWSNRGTVLAKLGRAEEALRDFDRALTLEAGNAETHHNRGLALHTLRRFDEALASFSHAVRLRPGYAEAWNNRGIALRAVGRDAAALQDFEQALKLVPRDTGALLNRANTLWSLGGLDEARATYDAILVFDPKNAAALHARGGLLAKMKCYDLAIADLQAAFQIQPDLPYLQGNLLNLKMTVCDWRDFTAEKAALDAAVADGRVAAEPFTYQALSDSPSALLQCARIFARQNVATGSAICTRTSRRPGRIRVGYVAGEFHNHATSILSAGLYEAHDRAAFEIFAFDNGVDDGSPMRRRLEAAIENIVPIKDLSDEDAARKIADEQIDILVNLNGHVGMLRTGIFARRPAPVQVNYLGFPGTMGVDFMDYILADKILIGEEDQRFYDEKIAWLPDSYQINDSKRALPKFGATRFEHGLPEQAFVFCHFNASYKITPDRFACWIRLLAQTDDSVLWLLEDNDQCAANLRRAAQAAGINPARLIFAPMQKQDEHMARLALADLFLDTNPCNAHTTASDALWAGLPLLTCHGGSFAGRVAASLLMAADLPELVAASAEDYEAMALKLAQTPALLASLRKKLEDSRTTASLFDTAKTTRHMETAYRRMLENWEAAYPPRSFAV